MQIIDPQGTVSIEVIEPHGRRARMRGLLGQDDLPAGKGLLLRTKQVHTVGMRFTIDAVYLGSAGDVLRVATMVPGRLGPYVRKARWILEMRAGEAARLGIGPGTELVAAQRTDEAGGRR